MDVTMTITEESNELARPPYDPELAAMLAVVATQLPPTITPEVIAPMREGSVTPTITGRRFAPSRECARGHFSTRLGAR
jgi:hypothetical protein